MKCVTFRIEISYVKIPSPQSLHNSIAASPKLHNICSSRVYLCNNFHISSSFFLSIINRLLWFTLLSQVRGIICSFLSQSFLESKPTHDSISAIKLFKNNWNYIKYGKKGKHWNNYFGIYATWLQFLIES